MSGQTGWRWCHKCQGLFFAGNPDQGVCPADQQAHESNQSGKYAVFFDDVSLPFEAGWRRCRKCEGLFFTGIDNGVCPAGTTILVESPHDLSQSGQYVGFLGDGSLPGIPSIQIGQGGWKRCTNCQVLFFGGNPSQGACPAAETVGAAHGGGAPVIAGPHEAGPEGYAVPWDFPKPTSRQFDSGWLSTGIAVGGWMKILMNKSGDYDFQSYAHDSGFDNIDYTISGVVMGSDLFAFTFQHSGSVEGTVAGLPFGSPNRDDSFTANTANNPVMAAHWDAILEGQLQARIDGTDTIVRGIGGLLGDMVKSAATSLGGEAASVIVSLL